MATGVVVDYGLIPLVLNGGPCPVVRCKKGLNTIYTIYIYIFFELRYLGQYTGDKMNIRSI